MRKVAVVVIAAMALAGAPSVTRAGTTDACHYASHAKTAAGFVELAPGSSQTITQPGATSLTVDSRMVTFRSGDPEEFGEVVIARDSADTQHRSVIGQAGEQAHLRLSFGKDKTGTDRPQHLIIGPYNYGAAVEYPGVLEFWVEQFSVHNNHQSRLKTQGAWFWVGDEIDSGGLFATSHYDPDLSKAYSSIASDMFSHTSHGSLHFQLRDPQDAFRFQWGKFGDEITMAQFGRMDQSSYLSLSSGVTSGFLEADDSTETVRLGSEGMARLELLAGDSGAGVLSILPSGGVEIPAATGYLAIGNSPATSGAIRLCPDCGIGFGTINGGSSEGLSGGSGETLLHERTYAGSASGFYPTDDGARDLGLPGNRWNEIWAMRLQSSGPIVAGFNLVPSSPTPEFDASLGNTQKIVLEEDATESTLTNAAAGQALHFVVCQDANGKHKFTWPKNMKGGMNVAPQAGRCNAQTFVFDGYRAWATAPGVIGQ